MRRILLYFLSLGQLWAQFSLSEKAVLIDATRSSFDESRPVYNSFFSALFFTRSRHIENAGGRSDTGDIWFVVLRSTGFDSVAQQWVRNTSSETHLIGFAKQGRVMYFSEKTTDPGTIRRTIQRSVYINGSWQPSQQVIIPYFRNTSTHQSGWISDTEDVLLLSVESFGSYGHEDLYVSLKEQGAWTPLKNLGRQINTSYEERSPFLMSEGRTLIFSTNGRVGEGSWDVYVSHRLGDGWTKWSEPKSLGQSINSTGSEHSFFFCETEQKAYFARQENSESQSNLLCLSAQLSSSTEAQQTYIRQTFICTDQKNDTRLLSGTSIRVTDLDNQIDTLIQVQEDGSCDLSLSTHRRTYTLTFSAQHFLPLSYVLQPSQEIQVLKFHSLHIGEDFVVDNIYFEKGKSTLLAHTKETLLHITQILSAHLSLSLFISGHTDNQGDASKNLRLSQARVQAIIDYLTQAGIDATRLQGKGYGGTQPIASNKNEKTRALNRRVTLRFFR